MDLPVSLSSNTNGSNRKLVVVSSSVAKLASIIPSEGASPGGNIMEASTSCAADVDSKMIPSRAVVLADTLQASFALSEEQTALEEQQYTSPSEEQKPAAVVNGDDLHAAKGSRLRNERKQGAVSSVKLAPAKMVPSRAVVLADTLQASFALSEEQTALEEQQYTSPSEKQKPAAVVVDGDDIHAAKGSLRNERKQGAVSSVKLAPAKMVPSRAVVLADTLQASFALSEEQTALDEQQYTSPSEEQKPAPVVDGDDLHAAKGSLRNERKQAAARTSVKLAPTTVLTSALATSAPAAVDGDNLGGAKGSLRNERKQAARISVKLAPTTVVVSTPASSTPEEPQTNTTTIATSNVGLEYAKGVCRNERGAAAMVRAVGIGDSVIEEEDLDSEMEEEDLDLQPGAYKVRGTRESDGKMDNIDLEMRTGSSPHLYQNNMGSFVNSGGHGDPSLDVVAEQIEAETIVFAEDVEEDNEARIKRVVRLSCGLTCLVIAFISVICLLFVPRNDKQVCPNNDPRCCMTSKELNEIEQCYCFGTLEQLAESLTDDETAVYNHLQNMLLFENVWQTNHPIDSCHYENQALMAMANFGPRGFTYETYMQTTTLGLIPNATIEMVVPNSPLYVPVLRFVVFQVYPLFLLYANLGGADWYEQDKWMTTYDYCFFQGISCNHLMQIESLHLPANNLNGTMPQSLSYFGSLKYLDLSDNPNLVGHIPDEIFADMPSLIDLKLRRSGVSGSIPSEIGYLTRLNLLDLGYNSDMTGHVPSEIGNMELVSLYLDHVGLKGTIPSELGRQTGLRDLVLHANELTGTIPSELQACTKLEVLKVSSNRLGGSIPSFLTRLERIESTRLFYSGLSGSPGVFCNRYRKNSTSTATPIMEYEETSRSYRRPHVIVVNCQGEPSFSHNCSCCTNLLSQSDVVVACIEDIPPYVADGFLN